MTNNSTTTKLRLSLVRVRLIVVKEITLGAFVTGALLEVPARLLRVVLRDHFLQPLLHFRCQVRHIVLIMMMLIGSTPEHFRIVATAIIVVQFGVFVTTSSGCSVAEVAGIAELARAPRPKEVPAWRRVFTTRLSKKVAAGATG